MRFRRGISTPRSGIDRPGLQKRLGPVGWTAGPRNEWRSGGRCQFRDSGFNHISGLNHIFGIRDLGCGIRASNHIFGIRDLGFGIRDSGLESHFRDSAFGIRDSGFVRESHSRPGSPDHVSPQYKPFAVLESWRLVFSHSQFERLEGFWGRLRIHVTCYQ